MEYIRKKEIYFRYTLYVVIMLDGWMDGCKVNGHALKKPSHEYLSFFSMTKRIDIINFWF